MKLAPPTAPQLRTSSSNSSTSSSSSNSVVRLHRQQHQLHVCKHKQLLAPCHATIRKPKDFGKDMEAARRHLEAGSAQGYGPIAGVLNWLSSNAFGSDKVGHVFATCYICDISHTSGMLQAPVVVAVLCCRLVQHVPDAVSTALKLLV
jgi:hypothetical protein